MRLGELEIIFECEPEGSPLNPKWIEADPDTKEEPAEPAKRELVPSK